MVSNAGCADKDLAHIRAHLKTFQNKGGDVDLKIIDDHALVALQGPKAAAVLESLVGKDLRDFPFMDGRYMTIKGIDCHVARSGYTGEDGFEVSAQPLFKQKEKKMMSFPSVVSIIVVVD